VTCCPTGDGARRDLVRSRAALLLWCVPTALVLIGAFSTTMRSWLWIPSLLVMGVACLMNAARCGRFHCHLTGPLFLLGALATALDILDLFLIGWTWILVGLGLGAALAFALEWVRGTYVGR
jgi:phosphoglycerol transferase MdoB-like AlkP superfamily enzyme